MPKSLLFLLYHNHIHIKDFQSQVGQFMLTYVALRSKSDK